MSASCREHLPLLCDDCSDEDFRIRKSSPKLQRLFRYSASSGRARTQTIGAAAIITRWPEHFSSLVTYLWIGLGMIVFMIFVIYNSMIVITMLPPTHIKPVKNHNNEYSSENASDENSKTNIFMHIFVTNYEELDMNIYLPYIDAFSKKYINLKHNLIVVLKDVSHDSDYLNNLNDELNNEIALNSLWMEKKKDNKIKSGKNINIQIISLTKYMDESPLKKYWRRLPQQFFGFLTRCIAIWDKGGIAFDPLILTQNSNSDYLQSLEHILSNLKSNNVKKVTKEKIFKIPTKKKVNNIQDIIDNIENQDKYDMQESLLEAENKRDIFKIDNLNINRKKRNVKGLPFENYEKIYINNNQENKTRHFEEILHEDEIDKNSVVSSEEKSFNYISTTQKPKNKNKLDYEVTTKNNLLPMFLEYLFHQPRNVTEYAKEQSIENVTINKNDENPIKKQENNSIATTLLEKKVLNILYAKRNSSESENNISLSIDLKGSLIATETPCHAFIGTIFSNALHHTDDESITDFIITELSIFCKGILSSCNGIDVILL